jgi:hypothetical protein
VKKSSLSSKKSVENSVIDNISTFPQNSTGYIFALNLEN